MGKSKTFYIVSFDFLAPCQNVDSFKIHTDVNHWRTFIMPPAGLAVL